jgi:hypothetical protein
MILDDLQYGSATKTSQWFHRWIGLALLRREQGEPNIAPNFSREAAQVFSA